MRVCGRPVFNLWKFNRNSLARVSGLKRQVKLSNHQGVLIAALGYNQAEFVSPRVMYTNGEIKCHKAIAKTA
jgi:hypothetical protein